jgi:uncharacterized protein
VTTTADDAAGLVLGIYEAFARKDMADVFARLDVDVEMRQSEELPWGGCYRGHDQALQFLGTLASHLDAVTEIDRVVVAGDTVVVVGRLTGHLVASGTRLSVDPVHVWRVRNGKAVRFEAFLHHPALDAALNGRR